MRITVNGQRADASARRFIEPRLWNTAKGKAVENGRGCKELNFYLFRKCYHITTTKYLKNFKKITRLSLSKKWMKNDPFTNVCFHLENVERDFLEKHELKKLLDKTIDIPLSVTRANDTGSWVYIIALVNRAQCSFCITGIHFWNISFSWAYDGVRNSAIYRSSKIPVVRQTDFSTHLTDSIFAT